MSRCVSAKKKGATKRGVMTVRQSRFGLWLVLRGNIVLEEFRERQAALEWADQNKRG